MTTRAHDFIQEWIEQNLVREPSSDHLETAEALTLRCLHEAEAKGIRRSEIEEEIGDLRSFIKEALESTADEEGDDEDTI
jgi:hypothetical protein